MAKKTRSKAASKAKIQKRALNAFEIAEKAENRNRKGSDSESDDPFVDPDASDREDQDEDVAEEDDEEIDSDEAFGSSDEEEILDSRNWKNKRKAWKKKNGKGGESDEDIEESEEEEGYSSIDESELLPLSAVWDLDDKDLQETMKAGIDGETTAKANEIKINEQAGASSSSDSGSDSGSEEEEESDDESDSELDSDDNLSVDDADFDDVDEEKLSSLRAMISDLSNNEIVTEENAAKNLKKNKLEQMGNVAEGEFSVPTGASGKLSLADLTNSISDSRAAASLSLLQDGRDKAAPLSVPLPKRLQERLDRSAAYDISKKEVSKWKDTVAANKNAEHLQFPINPAPEFTKPSSFAPLDPETSLEKRVNAILEESALADEKSEATFEQLAPSTLSISELRKRRNELRMMRELMFREEQKAKRIKKIKSKTYRKIHKKQRERERDMVEGQDEDSDEAAADHDAKRAEERMSLRHKNTGKWAKSMVQQGFTKDKATRSEMEEMLRRGEQLRTKILGRDENEAEEENNDEEFLNEQDASDDEETKRIKERAGKGVLAMKFMKDAEEAARKRNQLAKQELRNSMEGSLFDEVDESKGANEILNEGRRKYTPGSKESREEIDDVMDEVADELEADEVKSIENRLSQKRKRLLTDREPETKSIRADNTTASKSKSDSLGDFAMFDSEPEDEEESEQENPWLTTTNGSNRKSKSVTVVGRDSTAAEKSQEKVRKQKEKLRSGKKAAAHDGIIDMNQTLKVVDPFGSDVESEEDDEAITKLLEAKPKKGGNRVQFKQTDLVKRAFAADDVVAEFEEEKREIIAEDGDKEVDVTLPGWGSWGGTDIVPKKKYIKKVKGVVNEKNRQDFNLDKVIINEKPNKKASIYNATNVPFPFETREQYERSLRMPIGQEWSTRAAHQKLIKPRVIVKPGLVIDPIKAPFQNGEESD